MILVVKPIQYEADRWISFYNSNPCAPLGWGQAPGLCIKTSSFSHVIGRVFGNSILSMAESVPRVFNLRNEQGNV